MSFWSFGVGIWSHSCLIYVSSCWRVRGHLWRIFCLMMRQMLSIGEISGLQAGQFSTWTILLRSHAVVIAAVCGCTLSHWNTQGIPWNRRRLEESIRCSKIFYIFFSIHSAYKNLQAAHIVCTYAPPYHQRCWLLNWILITCWKVSLLFSRCPWFPTRMSNLDSSDYRICFLFETVHFKWALAHRTQRRFWTMFTYGFLFAW